MRTCALAALLALAACSIAGCHRPQADQPTPGADTQAQTAAKTIADLQAADAASQGPAPVIAPAHPPRAEKAKPAEEVDTPPETDAENMAESNAT